ncbi:hypothetical protein A3A76_02030 [Candidatus Woesebacteria bacterium RIFCSPLOWO2_01_FULL_39_23]|uniref:Metallopeptidase family protein n=1 Tax=Candidatus Woesebacteria bacterium RIFCSPHIGHO2_01_FULL_40_22 TaxID=1802499 RepID=A0A1F7YFS7_9BACT|nr:MAG: hypothetical protein A2141_03175 [Candidatus Woesebacteria bacterium RBG_16_40_11]OGM26177.1 MAG: hypothetical protein A2628_02460 [Candidatus Woesebacteria bacterium RIFCSPHIGHO2_01_FULL_40_22]OGM37964.1 MAG: hypothetical protein A3E41_03540 [Candidatus Woesebacteria bacterium RIFCSPHIGHO2_12_FULL_38_9]OGM62336.1 MAG: hypothetical protein A3A76_02030 [Candidatus Woesebacteria bacterium RIFCSPLOWO2_01_FULL_39_23]
MDDSQFRKLINRAISELPKEFLEKMENVDIVIEDWPNPHQIRELQQRGGGRVGLLLGLYQGIPRTKRGRYGIGPTLPDKISIFKRSILAISRSPEDVNRIVKDTVIHEIAHHFGLDDSAIHAAKSNKKVSKP